MDLLSPTCGETVTRVRPHLAKLNLSQSHHALQLLVSSVSSHSDTRELCTHSAPVLTSPSHGAQQASQLQVTMLLAHLDSVQAHVQELAVALEEAQEDVLLEQPSQESVVTPVSAQVLENQSAPTIHVAQVQQQVQPPAQPPPPHHQQQLPLLVQAPHVLHLVDHQLAQPVCSPSHGM